MSDLGDFIAGLEPGRKGEILGAAAEVFAEHGYDAGSMREIALRVGVSEPALYRHFAGKEALFLALMRLVSASLHREAMALIEGLEPERMRAQLLAVFADRRAAMPLYAPVLRSVFTSTAHNPRFLAEYREAMVDPLRARLTLKAAEFDAAFSVPDADATRDARVRALMALVMGFLVSSLVLADRPDEAIADALLRVMEWDGRA